MRSSGRWTPRGCCSPPPSRTCSRTSSGTVKCSGTSVSSRVKRWEPAHPLLAPTHVWDHVPASSTVPVIIFPSAVGPCPVHSPLSIFLPAPYMHVHSHNSKSSSAPYLASSPSLVRAYETMSSLASPTGPSPVHLPQPHKSISCPPHHGPCPCQPCMSTSGSSSHPTTLHPAIPPVHVPAVPQPMSLSQLP